MYRAHIGALVNEICMNKKMKFTQSNLKSMESRIRYVFQYFSKWYDCRKTRKDSDNIHVKNIRDKIVISSITYYVMHIGTIGFLGYCKYMLEKNLYLEYVPVLHANTSSIESHFSLMRCYDADTPSKYESTFNIADNEKSMKQLERNPMYPTNYGDIKQQ